jgi:hypothetical protein
MGNAGGRRKSAQAGLKPTSGWPPGRLTPGRSPMSNSNTTKQLHAAIELANVEDGHSDVLLSDPHLGPGLAWCRDGRLIYCFAERPPSQDDLNLWSVRINNHSGHLLGTPLRITGGPGGIDRVSLSAGFLAPAK